MKSMVVNELSLDGQFDNEQDFETNLKEAIKLFNIQKKLTKELFFSSKIYHRKITNDITMSNYLIRSRSDEARKLKVLLDGNFWDMNHFYSNKITYKCDNADLINGSSLAEACERKSNVFSFNHPDFKKNTIIIERKNEKICLNNFTQFNSYINDMFEDIVNNIFKELKQDFAQNFKLLTKISAIKQNIHLIASYEWSTNFEKNLINIPVSLKIKAIEQITKRLSMTRDKASINESLNDEPIRGLSKNANMRRFYITKKIGRIHYYFKDECIIFESLNTQHDKGLA